MNGNPVKEIPIVPRREFDERMTRDQYDALMNSESGGQMRMYQTASLTDTLGRDEPEPDSRRKAKKPKVDHDDHDDCFCEQPITEEEATPDEHLPPTTGGVADA